MPIIPKPQSVSPTQRSIYIPTPQISTNANSGAVGFLQDVSGIIRKEVDKSDRAAAQRAQSDIREYSQQLLYDDETGLANMTGDALLAEGESRQSLVQKYMEARINELNGRAQDYARPGAEAAIEKHGNETEKWMGQERVRQQEVELTRGIDLIVEGMAKSAARGVTTGGGIDSDDVDDDISEVTVFLVEHARSHSGSLEHVVIPKEGQTGYARVRQIMEDHGIEDMQTAAWIEVEERAAHTRVHSAALDGLIDEEDDVGAKAYLFANKHEMSPDSVALYQAQVDNASLYGESVRAAQVFTDQNEANFFGDIAEGDPTPTQHMLSAIKEAEEVYKDNPKLLDLTKKQIRENFRQAREDADAVLAEQELRISGKYSRTGRESAVFSDPWYERLTPDGKRNIQSQIAFHKDGKLQTDAQWEEYFLVDEIRRNDPERFAAMNLVGNKALSPQAQKYFGKLQDSDNMFDTEGDASALVEEYLKLAWPKGLTATSSEKQRREYSKYKTEAHRLLLAEAQNPNRLNPMGELEMREFLDPLFSEAVLSGASDFNLGTPEWRNYYLFAASQQRLAIEMGRKPLSETQLDASWQAHLGGDFATGGDHDEEVGLYIDRIEEEKAAANAAKTLAASKAYAKQLREILLNSRTVQTFQNALDNEVLGIADKGPPDPEAEQRTSHIKNFH